ncbi:MAG TPA: tandem-95 repeat protein, partial [Verrucomicrobia bacterium]|nr:tandem-95 repeat protein [Verrucomicrobiota bacterium]
SSGAMAVGAGGDLQIIDDVFVDHQSGTPPQFNIEGILRKTGGVGATIIEAEFINSGVIQLESGLIRFLGGFVQDSGTTLLNGGDFETSGTANFNGGLLSGSGTIQGNVFSAGNISPGLSIGTISIIGNLTLDPAAAVDIELTLSEGIVSDRIEVTGNTIFGGSLQVIVDGFIPAPGDSAQIMTFDSRAGEFAEVLGLDVGSGLALSPKYETQSLFLLTTSVPTITAIADQLTQVGAVLGPLSFTITDVETAAGLLIVEAFSSNPALIAGEALVLGGSDSIRTVTVIPTPGQEGTVIISLRVTDEDGAFSEANFQVTVFPGNQSPSISSILNQVIDEDETTGLLGFTIGDFETEPDSLILTAASSNEVLVLPGSIVLSGTGIERFVEVSPQPDQSGSATISLSLSDGEDTTTTNFEVTVNAVNDAPVATNDVANTNEDTPVEIDVVSNDTDADGGDVLSLISVDTTGLSGSVAINGSGTLTYNPIEALDEMGIGDQRIEIFTYTVGDSSGETAVGSVEVNVSGVNDAPVAEVDVAVTDEDQPVRIEVVANDSDPDLVTGEDRNDNFSPLFFDFEGSAPAQWNPLSIDASHEGAFTRFAGRYGNENLALTVDGLTSGIIYTVRFDLFIIDSWDGDEVGSPDRFMVFVDGLELFSETFNAFFEVNPQSFPGDPDESGSFGFNTSWPDSIYRGLEVSFQATGAQAVLSFAASALQELDDESWGVDNVLVQEHVDPGVLRIVGLSQASHGQAVINEDSISVTYTPEADFNGNDSFTYTLSDGFATDVGTVNVEVRPVNDPPTAVEDGFEVVEGSGFNILDVLANDSIDPDVGETLEILSAGILSDVTQPGDIIVASSDNSPGSEGAANAIDDQPTKYLNFDIENTGFTVTPSVGATIVTGLTLQSANDSPDRDHPASYLLEGSNDGSSFSTISQGGVPAFAERFDIVQINFNNSSAYTTYRLIFPSVSGSTCCMQIAEVEFLGSQGQNHSIGGLPGGPPNTFIEYEVPTGFVGTDSFSYTIGDGNGGTAEAVVTVNVIPANLPPVIVRSTEPGIGFEFSDAESPLESLTLESFSSDSSLVKDENILLEPVV